MPLWYIIYLGEIGKYYYIRRGNMKRPLCILTASPMILSSFFSLQDAEAINGKERARARGYGKSGNCRI